MFCFSSKTKSASMACGLEWIPDTLYNTSISAVARNYTKHKNELKFVQADMLFDIYYQLYKEGQLFNLKSALSNLEVFGRLLKEKGKRHRLHHCFQALMDTRTDIANDLANSYKLQCSVMHYWAINSVIKRTIEIGFLLCDFLSDAGWYEASEKVIEACMEILRHANSEYLTLESYTRLLHVRTSFCKFALAGETYTKAKQLFVNSLVDPTNSDLAGLYAEFTNFFFACCNYEEAYRWSIEALKTLSHCKNPKVAISVLRHAAKACVMKREFARARLLIEQALLFCRNYFGDQHPLMAMTLRDYGFYLLNVDCVPSSVKVYQVALDTNLCIFGGQNLQVAIAHSDLAYCHYIHEYSSGNFPNAKEHADKATRMMRYLLPPHHLLNASTKRVKALVLEDMAIDSHNQEMAKRLLLESHELLTYVLKLGKKAYGEINVQTARHYDDLGCLYQSMQRFDDSRDMLVKAIKIKKQLLGSNDYEVSLSVSHLASLYNYDMNLFKEAETLYLRSIDGGIRTFGNTYGGLRYHYSGLVRVYQNLNDEEKMHRYIMMLNDWMLLRKQKMETERKTSPLEFQSELIPCERLLSNFLKLQ